MSDSDDGSGDYLDSIEAIATALLLVCTFLLWLIDKLRRFDRDTMSNDIQVSMDTSDSDE